MGTEEREKQRQSSDYHRLPPKSVVSAPLAPGSRGDTAGGPRVGERSSRKKAEWRLHPHLVLRDENRGSTKPGETLSGRPPLVKASRRWAGRANAKWQCVFSTGIGRVSW